MGKWRKHSVAREKGRGRQWSDTLSICSSHEVEKCRAGRSGREEARWAGGKSQKATDRKQEPGLGGWFQMMDGTKYSVSTVPRDCWQVSSSFLLSSAAGAQAATRDEARGEDCTLHSALKRQRVVVRREKERESVGGSDGVEKKRSGLVAPKQQSCRRLACRRVRTQRDGENLGMTGTEAISSTRTRRAAGRQEGDFMGSCRLSGLR